MAKTRHRTFEIFDFLQEASDALASKSARPNSFSLDPDLWRFNELEVAIQESGAVHVTFKKPDDEKTESLSGLNKDLIDLADLLTNGSRVVLDFEGVVDFGADPIAKLTEFDAKLKNRGSRLILCNLESTVHAEFFPHRKPASS